MVPNVCSSQVHRHPMCFWPHMNPNRNSHVSAWLFVCSNHDCGAALAETQSGLWRHLNIKKGVIDVVEPLSAESAFTGDFAFLTGVA